jgi:hypothetical protein
VLGAGMLTTVSPVGAYSSTLPLTGSQGNASLCAQLAYNAGFRGSDLVTIVEISMAESYGGGTYGGGSIGCRNITNAKSGATGPWQELAGWKGKACSDLTQLWCNAATALYIKQVQGWGAWKTYTSGWYADFAPEATNAILSSNSTATSFYGSSGTITMTTAASVLVGSGGGGLVVAGAGSVSWSPSNYTNTAGLQPGAPVTPASLRWLTTGSFHGSGSYTDYYQPYVKAALGMPWVNWSCGSAGSAFQGGCSHS